MDNLSFGDLLGSLWGLALVAIFFGGSIFVHELGHFLAARKRGLKIERFSIGFGPRLFKTLLKFALMLDLLLDAGQLTADAVAFGLDFGKRIRGVGLLATALFDLRLGMALLGKQLLQMNFAVTQGFLVLTQFLAELAVIHGFELGIFFGPLDL